MKRKNLADKVISERDALAVSNCPYIVHLYYSLQTSSHIYLVMEYLIGGDLKTLLLVLGYLKENHAAIYTVEISIALEYLHARGIIHRDLKPDNILINASGHLKLTDFGLSTLRWNRGIRPNDVLNTPSVSRLPAEYYRTPGQLISLTSEISFTESPAQDLINSVVHSGRPENGGPGSPTKGHPRRISQPPKLTSKDMIKCNLIRRQRSLPTRLTFGPVNICGLRCIGRRMYDYHCQSEAALHRIRIASTRVVSHPKPVRLFASSPPLAREIAETERPPIEPPSIEALKQYRLTLPPLPPDTGTNGSLSAGLFDVNRLTGLWHSPTKMRSPTLSRNESSIMGPVGDCPTPFSTPVVPNLQDASHPSTEPRRAIPEFIHPNGPERSMSTLQRRLEDLQLTPTSASESLALRPMAMDTEQPNVQSDTPDYRRRTVPDILLTAGERAALSQLYSPARFASTSTGLNLADVDPTNVAMSRDSLPLTCFTPIRTPRRLQRKPSTLDPESQQMELSSRRFNEMLLQRLWSRRGSQNQLTALREVDPLIRRGPPPLIPIPRRSSFLSSFPAVPPPSPNTELTFGSLVPALPRDERLLGTPEYLAPELLISEPHFSSHESPAVDWWSLGVILFEMLTGSTPFADATPEAVFSNVLRLDIPWPESTSDSEPLSAAATSIITDLLTRNPDDRLRVAVHLRDYEFLAPVGDWAGLDNLEMPFIPCPDDSTDTSYFQVRNDYNQYDITYSGTDFQKPHEIP